MSTLGRVGVVFVTHNSAAVIEDALASLPSGVDSVVIDNASSDQTRELVARHDVPLFASPTNLGFGQACNLGAEHFDKNCEFLLFLNPDATLKSGALESLVAAADAHQDCAAFNPRILRPDGSQFFRVRSHLFPETKGLGRQTPDGDQPITVLSGAALFIRKAVFDELGGFDADIFLYAEDDELGLRVLNSGRQMRYVHQAVVIHQGNRSSLPTQALDKAKAYHEMRSKWYTAQKHGAPFSRWGQALQSAVNWGFAAVTLNRRARTKYGARVKALLDPDPAF